MAGKTAKRCELRYCNNQRSRNTEIKKSLLNELVTDENLAKNWVKISKVYEKTTGDKVSALELARVFKQNDDEKVDLNVDIDENCGKTAQTDSTWSDYETSLLKSSVQRHQMNHSFLNDDQILKILPEKPISNLKSKAIQHFKMLQNRSDLLGGKDIHNWDAMEDLRLEMAIQIFGIKNISSAFGFGWFPFKYREQCMRRYVQILPDFRTGGLTSEELTVLDELCSKPENFVGNGPEMVDDSDDIDFTELTNLFNVEMKKRYPDQIRTKRTQFQLSSAYHNTIKNPEKYGSYGCLDSENAVKESNRHVDVMTEKMYRTRRSLADRLVIMYENGTDLDESGSNSNFELEKELKVYEKIHLEWTSSRNLTSSRLTKWQTHFDVDTELRDFYCDNLYSPIRAIVKTSPNLEKVGSELQKINNCKNVHETSKFYAKLHQGCLPANQANLTALNRLQGEIPNLLETASKNVAFLEKGENSENGENGLSKFPRNYIKATENYEINSFEAEYKEAKKGNFTYQPEVFSPCDAQIRLFNYEFQRKHDLGANSQNTPPFPNLSDHERLAISLGVNDSQFSPVPEILSNGKLHTICEKAFVNNHDKTEIHYIAGQYSKLLRSFNSVFTWPILMSQQMPKNHHWARNFSRDRGGVDGQAKLVGNCIDRMSEDSKSSENVVETSKTGEISEKKF